MPVISPTSGPVVPFATADDSVFQSDAGEETGPLIDVLTLVNELDEEPLSLLRTIKEASPNGVDHNSGVSAVNLSASTPEAKQDKKTTKRSTPIRHKLHIMVEEEDEEDELDWSSASFMSESGSFYAPTDEEAAEENAPLGLVALRIHDDHDKAPSSTG